MTSCAECGGTNLLRDNLTGELVCSSCGVVIHSTQFNTGPEWSAYTLIDKDKLPRVGAPTNWMIHDKGLSTTIGRQDRDFTGRKLNPDASLQLYRLRKWQRRSQITDSVSRNLVNALNEMNSIGSRLNLPKNVIETASMIYRRALKAKLIRGRPIPTVAVVCIYIACRQCGVVRTLDDLSSSVHKPKKEITRIYRFLYNELKPNVPPVDTKDYIGKIVNNLALTWETEHIAQRILNQISILKLTGGRCPSGIAAACVYISTIITGDHSTQGSIAAEAQVTEVTIRNRYKEMVEHLDLQVEV